MLGFEPVPARPNCSTATLTPAPRDLDNDLISEDTVYMCTELLFKNIILANNST